MSFSGDKSREAVLVRPLLAPPDTVPRTTSLLRRAVAPLALVVLWALASGLHWVDPSVVPPPGLVASTLTNLWTEQHLLRQVAVSLGRAAEGSAIGIAVGLLLGISAGLSRLGEELFDAFMQMLRTVPFLALVPLFIVWFGIGESPKLLLIALATMFPMYLNSYGGVRNIDRKLIEAMHCFGLSGPQLIRQVVIPLALPSILTGLRFSLGVAVLVLVAAEQINTSEGIGFLLASAQLYQQVDVLLICLAIYALLGLAADLAVRLLERTLMPWRRALALR